VWIALPPCEAELSAVAGGSHRLAEVLEGSAVTDVVFVLVTLGGFALMGLLAKAVERL
jgi:hypothetical protein